MRALVQKAIFLSWFTVIYNLLEGAVSIGFGVSDDSVALAGFGVDSLIEVGSALLILWRFRSEASLGSGIAIARERKATLGIGTLFLVLAITTSIASCLQLKSGSHPATTVPGTVIAIVSLSFMFWLWTSKLKLAHAMNSAAMEMDAACSLACIKLSGVLLSGSLVFIIAPSLWWADSVAALVIAFFIGKQGFETTRAALKPEFSGGCGCACAKTPERS
ncbi:MAG TPA: heavy metal transporter [Bdellovibrionales bacterium]|nr:MAG: heavy metal transporter [Bdellovibrionales bacterium GWA1_52_35]OFZ39766.1 MAG: heavy metal transporter [Bdellovibrionales bacterium GWC1_52_8]HAR44191.1 heavy metal transporter [Bdellovibrionales bacterium]HCM41599.1 heavy metal transporter [Bdellovibrionales bacterium]